MVQGEAWTGVMISILARKGKEFAFRKLGT